MKQVWAGACRGLAAALVMGVAGVAAQAQDAANGPAASQAGAGLITQVGMGTPGTVADRAGVNLASAAVGAPMVPGSSEAGATPVAGGAVEAPPVRSISASSSSASSIAASSSSVSSSSVSSSVALPDSPGAVLAAYTSPEPEAPPAPAAGGHPHRVVQPGAAAPPLTAGDKYRIAFRSGVSLGALGSSLLGAGWGQWQNSAPHYGVDKGAFGERLGSSAAKGFVEGMLSYGVYANAFHEDPRYYVIGPGHSFTARVIGSAKQVVWTRTDSGGHSVNYSKILGEASSTAISNVWYPDRDQTINRNLGSLATSFLTSAGGNELHEFIGDALRMIHHSK